MREATRRSVFSFGPCTARFLFGGGPHKCLHLWGEEEETERFSKALSRRALEIERSYFRRKGGVQSAGIPGTSAQPCKGGPRPPPGGAVFPITP